MAYPWPSRKNVFSIVPAAFYRMKPFSIIGSAACVLVLFCSGCQTASQAPLPNQPMPNTPVTLSPGDVIKFTFPAAAELNQSQKIRTDGKVSLPLVGEVQAAGKTLSGFQSELASLYKPQLRNSDVLVTLESGTATVVVSGYVSKPGKFTFDRPTTVFQAIMEAGGVNEYGNLGKVHLVRTIGGEQRTQVLDLKKAMTGETTKVYYVKDGDVIYVAQRIF
jgi:protein involved in polysaccharide export with SLBB domain